ASSPAPRPPDAEGPAYWRSFQLVVSAGFPPGLAGPRWTVRSERQPAGRRSSRALASLEPSLGALKPPLGSLKPSPWLAQAAPSLAQAAPWLAQAVPFPCSGHPDASLRCSVAIHGDVLR